MALIDELISQGWLKTQRIIDAFREVQRIDFLPRGMEELAELNEALSIGFGQTISQPLVVAFMIEHLAPMPGDKILDIGFGSGWTTAILAHIVSEGEKKSELNGKVIAIEVIPELKKFGENNVAKYSFIKKGIVQCIYGDGSKGYKKEAPFNKILCSASAKEIPQGWKEQLKIGGRIVTPIGTSIWCFTKINKKEFKEIEYPGFVFVPLVER